MKFVELIQADVRRTDGIFYLIVTGTSDIQESNPGTSSEAR